MTRAARVVALVVAACGGGHEERAHRQGSAAPVELVAEPVSNGAGSGSARFGSTKATLSGDEVEPNDTDELATPLPLGNALRGKLEPGDSDVDRFRIDVPHAGELAVFVSDVDAAVTLDIEDANGNLLARSERGDRGAKVREGVPNLGVDSGRYFAVVRGRLRPKPPHPQPHHRPTPSTEPPTPPIGYRVSAELVAPEPGAEREPDDDRATATDILLNDRGTGFIGWDHDADVWKLSVEGVSGRTGLDIDVGRLEGVGLELEVDDAAGQLLAARKQLPRGWPAQIHGLVPVLPPNSAPFLYVTVRGTATNPDAIYELSVRPVQLRGDAEIEPDDTPEHPFEVPAERNTIAATWTPGDVDCYLISSGQPAHSLDVGIDEPADLDLALDVLTDGKIVASLPHARPPNDHVVAKLPADARVVVRVRGFEPARTPAAGSYTLRIRDRGLP